MPEEPNSPVTQESHNGLPQGGLRGAILLHHLPLLVLPTAELLLACSPLPSASPSPPMAFSTRLNLTKLK